MVMAEIEMIAMIMEVILIFVMTEMVKIMTKTVIVILGMKLYLCFF